jgi:L-ascorbate metabolism protein UlaG (beta-lactamase superfamily)
MKITWLGHSAFLLETNGVRIVSDPYNTSDDRIRYQPIDMPADIVTVSHDHFDHNHVESLSGNPEIVKGAGRKTVKDITFTGIDTFHDPSHGSDRGENILYAIDAEKMRICHAGDLGHVLSADRIQALGFIDIIFIPVGGLYTVDAKEAWQIIQDISPKIVIPMHFKTPSLDFPIAPVDSFLEGKTNIVHKQSASFEITRQDLPQEMQIIVLDHLL